MKSSYRAKANPKNPTAPTIPAATAFVCAAPALLDLLVATAAADVPEAFVVITVVPARLVLVSFCVVTVELLTPLVLTTVAVAVPPVPTPVPAAPGSVVKPAATSKEMICGTMDWTLGSRPRT